MNNKCWKWPSIASKRAPSWILFLMCIFCVSLHSNVLTSHYINISACKRVDIATWCYLYRFILFPYWKSRGCETEIHEKFFQYPRNAVRQLIAKFLENGSVVDVARSGKPPVLTEERVRDVSDWCRKVPGSLFAKYQSRLDFLATRHMMLSRTLLHLQLLQDHNCAGIETYNDILDAVFIRCHALMRRGSIYQASWTAKAVGVGQPIIHMNLQRYFYTVRKSKFGARSHARGSSDLYLRPDLHCRSLLFRNFVPFHWAVERERNYKG